jgi:hypothetical protein
VGQHRAHPPDRSGCDHVDPEAIGVAVHLVAVYPALSLVVVLVGLWHVVTAGGVVGDWTTAVTTQHGNPLIVVGVALA